MHAPFVANTDQAWFDYLSKRSASGSLDEVNFWQPTAVRPMKRMELGSPVFFRLKKPHYAIAGYGFFAHFEVIPLDMAWEVFGEKNGAPDELSFLRRIGRYRELDLLDPRSPRRPLGCTVLRNAVFWPRERWIPWQTNEGWSRNIVQGATVTDVHLQQRLHAEILADATPQPAEFKPAFEPLEVDDRRIALSRSTAREGQGTFRLRLLSAYRGQCAITGEHTQPVLDGAHIQPYLGPASNHVQNGLLLTKDFHTLFDHGYVTITTQHRVMVSTRLKSDWHNGRRYYPYHGQELATLPPPDLRPSKHALEWHADTVFLG